MTSPQLDACLQLLADRRRRHVLQYLRREADGTVVFEELVDQLYNSGSDSNDGLLSNREELAIQLRHSHLPKLVDHSVVEFDHGSGTVRYQPDEQVETVLDSLPREASLPNA